MQIASLEKRLSCLIKSESAARRQMSGTRVWGFSFYFYMIVKHPMHLEFPPRVTATPYVYDVLIATSKDHVHIIQQALCTINNQCK